jgi:hypothetical protein
MNQFLTLLIVALTTVPVRAEYGMKVAKDTPTRKPAASAPGSMSTPRLRAKTIPW